MFDSDKPGESYWQISTWHRPRQPLIEIHPVGLLDAHITSGGTSTAPWTFEGKLRTYENKVLRYPRHFEWLRAFKTFGLFSKEPVLVDGQPVNPRAVYHALVEPQLTKEQPKDICIVRAIGLGLKDGKAAQVTVDLTEGSMKYPA